MPEIPKPTPPDRGQLGRNTMNRSARTVPRLFDDAFYRRARGEEPPSEPGAINADPPFTEQEQQMVSYLQAHPDSTADQLVAAFFPEDVENARLLKVKKRLYAALTRIRSKLVDDTIYSTPGWNEKPGTFRIVSKQEAEELEHQQALKREKERNEKKAKPARSAESTASAEVEGPTYSLAYKQLDPRRVAVGLRIDGKLQTQLPLVDFRKDQFLLLEALLRMRESPTVNELRIRMLEAISMGFESIGEIDRAIMAVNNLIHAWGKELEIQETGEKKGRLVFTDYDPKHMLHLPEFNPLSDDQPTLRMPRSRKPSHGGARL